jgi:ubiquinone/menaquinone biosynthesis C-methylase UbiE
MNNLQVEISKKYLKYLQSAKDFFERSSSEMKKKNHNQHQLEPNFWKYMLIPYQNNEGNYAMEYGCGAGRNLVNLIEYCGFERVDGIDISKSNCINSMNYV